MKKICPSASMYGGQSSQLCSLVPHVGFNVNILGGSSCMLELLETIGNSDGEGVLVVWGYKRLTRKENIQYNQGYLILV